MTAQSSQDRHQNGRFLPHIVACVLATSIVIKGKPALAQEGEAQVSTGSRLTIKLLAADSDGDGYRDLTEDEFPQDASEHKDEFRYDADRYAVATPDAAGILAVTSDLPIDAPAGRSSLSNPIVALNQNNRALIAYTVDSEIRVARYDGNEWADITVLFSRDGVISSTAPTMQLAMNNTGQAALVVQPNNSAIPQDENYQPYNALGIAYFDGGEWIWADVLRGNIKIAWNNREETDTIAISEAGDAILAYARQEREPGEAYNNAIASILRFDRSGILDSQDLGQKDVSYQGSWVDINTSGTVAVQFANYNYDTQLNHPLYVYDGESWIRLPSPPSVFGDPIHFFYNDNDNDNDTAALFLENGLQGYGFDGKEWHTFDPLPGFGSRRNDGHTVRTGPLSYTFVTTFFVTTFVDIQTDTRYYEAHEYDLSNLQSTKVISNELEYFQPRARLFDLDNGRLYLTEHAIEGWYENSSGQISAPTQLLFTEGATNSDMAVNRSGFGIIADNSNFILTAYTIQLR